MARKPATNQDVVIEATITSKGQVTLPKAVRSHLGLRTGSRIRFSLPKHGGFQGDSVLHELEDLWAMADATLKRNGELRSPMTLEEMDEAKARRIW